MVSRPRKRQKRLIVVTSDDEEGCSNGDEVENGHKPSRHLTSDEPTYGRAITRTQQVLPTRRREHAIKAPRTSVDHASYANSAKLLSNNPSKDSKGRATTVNGVGSRSISTLFKGRPDDQPAVIRTQRASLERDISAVAETIPELEEDAIEDESPVELVEKKSGTQSTTGRVLDKRKQNDEKDERQPIAGQRFKISTKSHSPQRQKRGEESKTKPVDSRPWADRYGPLSLEEIAVNKTKVAQVRTWLDRVWSGRDHRRLLILRGPSGAGKTTTVEMLAKNMAFDLSEWRNPVGSEFSSEAYSSMSVQFEEFLGRSGRFGRLDFEAEHLAVPKEKSSRSSSQSQGGRSKVILLEEFPYTSISSPTALRSFRSCILEYLSAYAPTSGYSLVKTNPSPKAIIPLIMIITETRPSSDIAASDSFTVHRLLGSGVLDHPSVSVVEFNPIAPTFLIKALDLVLRKEARSSGRRRIPGTAALKRLGEVGDIRSAIGSLEFLCVRGSDADDWGGRVAAKGKKAQGSGPLTNMEKQSLTMITQRGFSLGLFHAVGKVVYNKRDDPRTIGLDEQSVVQPPQHLMEHSRLNVPQANVNRLIDETGCDTSTFVAALHENYIRSCEGPNFMDSFNGCLDVLSDTDLIATSRGGTSGAEGAGYSGRAFQGAGVRSLGIEEITFQLAVRGLLFALPDPVRRPSHPVGAVGGKVSNADVYNMLYPTSMRLGKTMGDTGDLVDRWVTRLQASPTVGNKASNGPSSFLLATEKAAKHHTMHDAEIQTQEQAEPYRTSLNVTRNELIVERLPYICKIELHSSYPGQRRELASITQFRGLDIPSAESAEDDFESDAVVPPAKAIPALGATADITGDTKHRSSMGVEMLYLAEDDIEDD